MELIDLVKQFSVEEEYNKLKLNHCKFKLSNIHCEYCFDKSAAFCVHYMNKTVSINHNIFYSFNCDMCNLYCFFYERITMNHRFFLNKYDDISCDERLVKSIIK